MRITWSRPSSSVLDAYLTQVKHQAFNHPHTGKSKTIDRHNIPKGFNLDDNKVYLGQGTAVFEQAKQAISSWKMFDLNWVHLYPNTTAIKAGGTVAVSFRLFGIWWINSCEIVYTINEPHQFGFAYGTKEHVESGEEIFQVEMNAKGEVYYRIKAFSQPHFWLVKLVKSFARRQQARFVKESHQRMKALVQNPK